MDGGRSEGRQLRGTSTAVEMAVLELLRFTGGHETVESDVVGKILPRTKVLVFVVVGVAQGALEPGHLDLLLAWGCWLVSLLALGVAWQLPMRKSMLGVLIQKIISFSTNYLFHFFIIKK